MDPSTPLPSVAALNRHIAKEIKLTPPLFTAKEQIYPSSDDLVVFDSSLSWALFFWHEEQAFFASHPIKET